MTVRAKFICKKKDEYSINSTTDTRWNVEFIPVPQPYRVDGTGNTVADTTTENYKFWDATPVGTFSFGHIKKEVADQFIVGRQYYLDMNLAS